MDLYTIVRLAYSVCLLAIIVPDYLRTFFVRLLASLTRSGDAAALNLRPTSDHTEPGRTATSFGKHWGQRNNDDYIDIYDQEFQTDVVGSYP